jgi:NAD(P)-dependent dehydrogenase (short-subunit alcohol dehydrogenase family)
MIEARSAEFEGKVVVITGAGSGIGRSTALLFARLGAKVHVVDLDGDRAEAVRSTIEAAGGKAVAHKVDCTDPAAVEAFATTVFAEDGAVDVLHNNAGIGHAGGVEDTPLEDWQRVIAVNLMSTIHGVHAFVPRLLQQGRPSRIINTASAAGLVAMARMAPYCTTKFAIVGLTEALDAELSPRGIRVSAICPGIINTSIVEDSVMRGEMAQQAERAVAFYRKRGTSPDVVARAVVATVRRPRLVVPVPRWQVTPTWLLKRLSTRASSLVSRSMTRVLR